MAAAAPGPRCDPEGMRYPPAVMQVTGLARRDVVIRDGALPRYGGAVASQRTSAAVGTSGPAATQVSP